MNTNTHNHTYTENLRVASYPNMHVFRLWEESGVVEDEPRKALRLRVEPVTCQCLYKILVIR